MNFNKLNGVPKHETVTNPTFVFEGVDNFLGRLQDSHIPLPEQIEETLANLTLANHAMAQAAIGNERENLNATYATYVHLLSNMAIDKLFWDSLPDHIPYDQGIQKAVKNDLRILSNPANIHFSDSYTKEKYDTELSQLKERDLGESKEALQAKFQEYVLDLKKAYAGLESTN